MPKPRGRPVADKVEQDFLDALGRIKANLPRHPDLAAKAQVGTLKVSFSNVAKEAGRSRTLIGHERCRYPNIRAEIEAYITPTSEVRTAEDVIRRLRHENADLRRQIKDRDSVNAALILRMRKIETAAKREIASAQRTASRADNPNEVAGRSLDLTFGEILPMRKKEPNEV